jgi:glutamate racemase
MSELDVSGNSSSSLRIGVFDSGFGGLTVLRALLNLLPTAEFFYLGDTARLPYGSKSRTTVARYAAESARQLEFFGAQFLVIACNTASALALDAIRSAVAVPALGVIEAGAESAAARSHSRDVLVLATEATVASHAYRQACAARGLRIVEKACPLLVPLIEEGWTGAEAKNPSAAAVTRQTVRIYLDEAFREAGDLGYSPDVVLLGCTHYPLLRATLTEELPAELTILDSAETTAARVQSQLKNQGVLVQEAAQSTQSSRADSARCHFFATDSVEKFRALGSRFLGRPIESVTLVDLGG